jgi:polyhydroxyalkanoate synthase
MIDQSNELREFLVRLFSPEQCMFGQPVARNETNNTTDAASDTRNRALLMPTNFAELQQYYQQIFNFWMGWFHSITQLALGAPKETDKRFSADAWRTDPRFYTLQRTYLAYSHFMLQAAETAPMDEATKRQLRFIMRQIVDAMSPTNFFVTNPEAIQFAMETGGQSLNKGVELFMQDVAKGRISMSDEKAFEVGKNIALTEGKVIYENELIQFIQYKPLTEQVGQRPLVMIPPCINKFYILDLQPDNSLVRHAVEQGTTVFMLSWRNITPELGHLTWDDYLQKGVMKAIDVALDIANVDQVNTLGFCIGGALLSSAISVMKKNGVDKVASMTLLTTMLDYTDTGEIGHLVTEKSVTAKEQDIGKGGVMPGKELALTFSSLRANDLIWPYVVNSYLKGKAPAAFDLLYWNADATNLPGPMFTWYVRNTYLENNLRVPEKTVQCGVPVDLSNITIPTYIYASREDHLVPWGTCYESTELLKGDITFTLGASGHIAGVINPPAKNKRNYWKSGALGGTADAWFETAEKVPGSWWPHWIDWLKAQTGAPVPAPESLGNEHYQPIEPTPGRYVKQRAE